MKHNNKDINFNCITIYFIIFYLNVNIDIQILNIAMAATKSSIFWTKSELTLKDIPSS